MSEVPSDGMTRRDVLKRGAMVGGALVWTTPVVQSIAGPALAAAASEAPELCAFTLIVSVEGGTTGCVRVTGSTQECCDALNAANVLPDPGARFFALIDALAGPCSGAFTRTNCVV